MKELEVGKEYLIKQKYLEFVNDGNSRPLKFVDGQGSFHWYKEGLEPVEAIPEREKVKIDRHMDVYITVAKENGLTLQQGLSDFKPTNSEIFARAWLDGYEIEKEPLYWVRDNKGYPILVKWANGDVTSCSSVTNEVTQRKHKKLYSFTEKEIKDYDERYWAFAVPAEEDE